MIFNFIVNKLMDNIDGRGGGIKSCLLFDWSDFLVKLYYI